MTEFKKLYNSKVLLVGALVLFTLTGLSRADSNLRLPMGGWKERSGLETEKTTFDPVKKPISWASSPEAKKEQTKPIEDWSLARRVAGSASTPHLFKIEIPNLLPSGMPYKDIIAEALSRLEYFSEIKGRIGICYIWSCSACYILKDLPFCGRGKTFEDYR